ncbi:MAG: hypothetical protein K6D97_07215 [Clostridia bacterium]|nr:hypothetical protein [Clostridia bacterium]
MKKRLFLCILLLILVIALSKYIVTFNCGKEIRESNKLQKIKLNHISMTAELADIENVKFDKKIENDIKNKIEIYEIKEKHYTDEEIDYFVKCLGCSIIKKDNQKDECFYYLNDGSGLTYYKKSGSLSFYKNREDDYDTSKKELDKECLVKIASELIEKLGMFENAKLECAEAKPCAFVETEHGKEIERYQVIYSKKLPSEKYEYYTGAGLGITIELDAKGNIIGFVSMDKVIKKKNIKYPGKNIEDIKEDIINNKNVLIYTEDSEKSNIEVTDIELVLYNDEILESQEYMVPHYKLVDKDGQSCVILPAIDDKYITIKNN